MKVLGVMPWLDASIPGEDSLSLRWGKSPVGELSLGAVRFPNLANFTDLDPLELEPDVALTQVDERTPARVLRSLDAVILPGTKNSMQDMAWLHRTGLAGAIRDLAREGRFVFGICGGYQMLGRRLLDPDLRENGELTEVEGLGLLPAVTDFRALVKRTACVSGAVRRPFLPEGEPEMHVSGYELHFGRTEPDNNKEDFSALFEIEGHEEGLAALDLSVAGTYLHGVFENDRFRALWLNALRSRRGLPTRPVLDTHAVQEAAYAALAAAVEKYLDVEAVLALLK